MCLFTNRNCYSACIKVLPLYPFDHPYFSSQPHKVTICGRHVMASVRNIKIAEALLVLCFAYYVMKQVQHCRDWGIMAFTRYGGRVSRGYSPYFPQWVDRLQRCFSCWSLLILLYNGQNIAEYEAYWLMGFPIIYLGGHVSQTHSPYFLLWLDGMQGYFPCCSLLILLCNEHSKAEYEAYWLISVPIINPWGAHQPFFLQSSSYMQIKQLELLCFQKSKQTSLRKIL